MTSDLTAFLAARLDEDEHYVRTMIEVGERGAAAATPDDLADVGAMAVTVLSDPQVLPMLERWMDGSVPVPNDLRRLLGEIEVKRAILALHQTRHWQFPSLTTITVYMCAVCDAPGDAPDYNWCSTLRTMTAVYTDHPDYDAEWKP